MESYWRWSFEKNECGLEVELPWSSKDGVHRAMEL